MVSVYLELKQAIASSSLQESRAWASITWLTTQCEHLLYTHPCSPVFNLCLKDDGGRTWTVVLYNEVPLIWSWVCFLEPLASLITWNIGLVMSIFHMRLLQIFERGPHISQLLKEGNRNGCWRTHCFVSDIELGSCTENSSFVRKIKSNK